MEQRRETTDINGDQADENSETRNDNAFPESVMSNSSLSSDNNDDPEQQQQQQQHQQQNVGGEPNNISNNQQKIFREETKAFDDLLSREMMQLSLQARNDIQEEIHGVKCLAPIETPELLDLSIAKLDAQIDMIVRSSNSIPNIHISTRALTLARSLGDESYTNGRDFKLFFLRCELFDVRNAALRLCEYLEMIHSLFGEVCLKREPILHSDFTKDELRLIKKGYFQFLPFRDRSGRRIFVDFPSEDTDNMTAELMAKFLIYLSLSLLNDVETLRKGIIIIIWFDAKYRLPPVISLPARRSNLENFGKWVGVRISALHVCSPDTPAFRFRRSVIALRTIQNQRSRLRLHVGEPMELHYVLQGYGIPTDNIPMTWSGSIKTNNFKNWMKLRKAIEDDAEAKRQYLRDLQRGRFQSSSDSHRAYSDTLSNVVECPNSTDILFRQGTSLSNHPGNARFRSLIEASVVQLREELTKRSPQTNIESMPPSLQISTVVSEVFSKVVYQERYRVLVWTSNPTPCWCIYTNEDQIYLKIDYAVREHIRSVTSGDSGTVGEIPVSKAEKQKSNLFTNDSSTSIFQVESMKGAPDSCNEAVSSLFCGTTEAEASTTNKRSKTSSSNDENISVDAST